jgi:hypothetical protein
MLVLLGFFATSLIGLILAPAFWARAVWLTTKRIKESMPISEAEIRADKDRLRAEYAIKVHKLEMQAEQDRLGRARQLIEINRRDAVISALETELAQLRASVEENQNARRVLEQTISDRLPSVEARLADTRQLLVARDREIADLSRIADNQKHTLEEAAAINEQQRSEIDRLSTALTNRGARNSQNLSNPRFEGELALRSEIETLRAKTREQASLIDRLQSRLSQIRTLPPATVTGERKIGQATAEAINRLRGDLSQAEASLKSADSEALAGVERGRILDRENEALRAKSDDQLAEIARLRAALAAFEGQGGDAGKLMDSKIALKARLGAANAHSGYQAETIRRLRAELAATNERLALQATHYMEEMRRLGAGTSPDSGQARRPGRRSLAERVAIIAGKAKSTTAEAEVDAGRNGLDATADKPAHPGPSSNAVADPNSREQDQTDARASVDSANEPSLLARTTSLGKP